MKEFSSNFGNDWEEDVEVITYIYIVWMNDMIIGVFNSAAKASRLVNKTVKTQYLESRWTKSRWKTSIRGFNWSNDLGIARLCWIRYGVK